MAGDSPDDGSAPTEVAVSASADDATVPASDDRPATRPATDANLVGKTLGRYEIEYLIGKGGMGEVYAAYDPNLDRPVAIKVLLAGIRGEGHRARLVREAQALARLQHANVVAVYDAGDDAGRVFIAMQFVEGDTLAVHLRTTPKPWAEVVALYIAAGRGLSAAHAAGIVHRDFKPSNVLVDHSGHVAVTDFGIARHSGDPIESPARPSDPSGPGRKTPRSSDPMIVSINKRPSQPSHELTRQGELVGTPAYMPMEQLEGRVVTAATDQFAFCVALWEALFAMHPYAGEATDNSPLAFGTAIERGELHLPERSPVPRRIVNALTRGLERDPAKRWPSMNALIAELGRGIRPRRTRWIAAAAAVVVAGGATAAVLAMRGGAAPSCQSIARTRAAMVWSPARAATLGDRFIATGRGYAGASADHVRDRLGRYVIAWTAAETDACTVSRTGATAERQAADHRLACLDRARGAVETTVGVLTDDVAPEVVDNAGALVDRLPPLADCATGDARLAPPAIAARIMELDARLDAAWARDRLGQFREVEVSLAALAPDVAAVGWPPLETRFDYAIATNAAAMGLRAHDALIAVAARARTLGMHRVELDAAAAAMVAARDTRELDAAVTAGQEAAAALGGAEAAVQVAVAHGRGLARLRQFREASSLCRDSRKAAQDNHWTVIEDDATECLVSSLVPLSEYAELDGVLTEALATATTALGAEHPRIAVYLQARAQVLVDQGKYSEAEAIQDRVLAIRRRATGDHSLEVADALRELGETAEALQDLDRAKDQYDQALAIMVAINPAPDGQLWKIHRDLGMLAMGDGDMDAVRAHFDEAIAAATRQAGAESIEVAFLLVMYGQYQTSWDVDAGIATLRHAVGIFTAHADPRAASIRGALGNTLMRYKRWKEAADLLEDAVQHATMRETSAGLMGQMYFSLAKSLHALHEDEHARMHAEDAVMYFARANNPVLREEVRDWIHDNHLPPYRSDNDLRQLGRPIAAHQIKLTP